MTYNKIKSWHLCFVALRFSGLLSLDISCALVVSPFFSSFLFFSTASLLPTPILPLPSFLSLLIFILLKSFYSICFLPLRCKLFPTSKYNCYRSGQVTGLFYPYGAFWFELSATLPIMDCTGFWLRKMQQDKWVLIWGLVWFLSNTNHLCSF